VYFCYSWWRGRYIYYILHIQYQKVTLVTHLWPQPDWICCGNHDREASVHFSTFVTIISRNSEMRDDLSWISRGLWSWLNAGNVYSFSVMSWWQPNESWKRENTCGYQWKPGCTAWRDVNAAADSGSADCLFWLRLAAWLTAKLAALAHFSNKW